MIYKFDIRQHEDVCEMLNSIINAGKIAEIKVEKQSILTVVEIERRKRIPPRKE